MAESDAEAAAELQLATALVAYRDIFPPEAPKPTVPQMVAGWRRILRHGVGWVIEDEGVAGVVGLVPEPDGGRMESLYVAPNRWGTGLGSRLATTAEREAGRRGWVPLRLWVLEANRRTRAWYENRGWVLEEGRRRVVWGPVEDVGYRYGTDR
jgi:GNAT superfamily N-acetyltransferase